MRTALLDIGRALTEPTRARQRSADGGGTGGAAPSMVQGTPTGLTFWADGFGASGALDGDGNAAGADLSFGGLAAGADMLTQDGWRIGLAGGVARSDVNVASRSSSGTIDSQALALYFGRDWNGFSFRGGLAQGWHDIRTTRSVALSGGAQTLDGAYAARLTEVWAEASHEIETDRARFAPFVGLTHARLSTDGFSETGGTAALSVAAASGEATHATLGLRAETDLPLGNTHAVLGGMLAWQHAFGDTPLGQMEFVSGGDAFDISGVPPARTRRCWGWRSACPCRGTRRWPLAMAAGSDRA